MKPVMWNKLALHIAAHRARRHPTVRSWVKLLTVLEPELDAQSRALLRNHAFLSPNSALAHFAPEINASGCLRGFDVRAANAREIARRAIEELVARKTVLQCRDAHTEGGYYDDAEPVMDQQWRDLIVPHLAHFDVSITLELAPGHGRNSRLLALHGARALHLVDVNRTCIDACRARFGEQWHGCRFFYYVNNGRDLTAIADQSTTFVYSFDSMVHFDKTVVRAYLEEFARVLRPGGGGFVHHSNYGTFAPDSDWASNPGGRSDVSAELFRGYCVRSGLEVIAQHLHGRAEGRHMDGLDCVTLFRKPIHAGAAS